MKSQTEKPVKINGGMIFARMRGNIAIEKIIRLARMTRSEKYNIDEAVFDSARVILTPEK